MMLLGLPHVHDGDDLVVLAGWESMLEGFGFSFEGDAPVRVKDASKMVVERTQKLRRAKTILDEERHRLAELAKERATIRIAAETGARQRGLGIAETDKVGREAAASVPDEGPSDPAAYLAAQRLEDEHAIEGIMVLIRQLSDLRWEHSAPVRVGCRMGRPEKAAPRIMNPMTHSLFPIELNGGNQRLLNNALDKQTIRVQLGKRTCSGVEKNLPICAAIIERSTNTVRAESVRSVEDEQKPMHQPPRQASTRRSAIRQRQRHGGRCPNPLGH